MEAVSQIHLRHVPPTDLLRKALNQYIELVHPRVPFLDLDEISGNVREKVARGQLSQFLLTAMLAAAMPYIENYDASLAGFDSPEKASMFYFHVSKKLYNEGKEGDPVTLAAGFLLLSTCCAHPEPVLDDRRRQCITLAISFAKLAGLHLFETVHPIKEAKRRRRLAWCCFVQERIISMSAIASMPLPAATMSLEQIPEVSQDDFTFESITASHCSPGSPLLHDILAQMCIAYHFKLQAYLCMNFMGHPLYYLQQYKMKWHRIEAVMDVWYSKFVGLMNSLALHGAVHQCLVVQWENLVLLYQTVKLRCFHDSWYALQLCINDIDHRHWAVQGALKAWSSFNKVLRGINRSGRLQHMLGGSLMLILPAVLCFESLHSALSILESDPVSRLAAESLAVILSSGTKMTGVDAMSIEAIRIRLEMVINLQFANPTPAATVPWFEGFRRIYGVASAGPSMGSEGPQTSITRKGWEHPDVMLLAAL